MSQNLVGEFLTKASRPLNNDLPCQNNHVDTVAEDPNCDNTWNQNSLEIITPHIQRLIIHTANEN